MHNLLASWRIGHSITCELLYIYDSFHWNCYTLKIHRIEKLRIPGIARYKFKMRFWFGARRLRGCSPAAAARHQGRSQRMRKEIRGFIYLTDKIKKSTDGWTPGIYRRIFEFVPRNWVPGFGGFRWCSICSGDCCRTFKHNKAHTCTHYRKYNREHTGCNAKGRIFRHDALVNDDSNIAYQYIHSHVLHSIFRKRALQCVALLRKMTCNLIFRHNAVVNDDINIE